MSRDAGFAIADFSTSYHDDTKVKAMWRTLRDEAAMNAAMTLYEAVVLASWRDGKRMTAIEACPVWIADVAIPQGHLTDVGLLDNEGFIPRSTWNQWFSAVKRRRDRSRESWRRSKASARSSARSHDSLGEESTSTTTRSPRGHHEEARLSVPSSPSSPSSPSYPPSPARARAREKPGRLMNQREGPTGTGGLEPIGKSLAEMGFGPGIDGKWHGPKAEEPPTESDP